LIATSVTGEHEGRANAGFVRGADRYVGHTRRISVFP
jgi:hypothetical protein